jgi:ribose transport system permease protein
MECKGAEIMTQAISKPITDADESRLEWKSILAGSSRILALVILFIGISIASPHFLSVTNVLNVVRIASLILIVAFGEMVVILLGEIDLSVGAILTVSAIIAAGIIKGEVIPGTENLPYGVGILAGLAVGVFFGLLNGLLVSKVKLPSFIATYGMMFVANGAAIVAMGGYVIFNFDDGFRTLGRGYLGGIPIPVLLMAALALVLHFVLSQTGLGRAIYALGGNKSAAQLVGINRTKITIIAFMISGFCAAFAGILQVARLNAAEVAMGDFFLLPVVATVIVGGTSLSGGKGTVIDTIIGGLLFAFINNALTLLGVSSLWYYFSMGALIVLAVLVERLGRGADVIPSGH